MRKIQYGILNFVCHLILLLAIADPRLLETSLYMIIILNIIGCVYLAMSNRDDSNRFSNHTSKYFDK
jgi:hypothetical protein